MSGLGMAAAFSGTSATSKALLTNLGLEEDSGFQHPVPSRWRLFGLFFKTISSVNKRLFFLTYYREFQTHTKLENAASRVPRCHRPASTTNVWPILLQGSTVRPGGSRTHGGDRALFTRWPSPQPPALPPPGTFWRKEPSWGQEDGPYLCHRLHGESSRELHNTDVRHPHTAPCSHFIITRNYVVTLCRTGISRAHRTKSSPSPPAFV